MEDKLICPFCKLHYEEHFIEPLIRSSFKCTRCEGKIKVTLNQHGYILLCKRTDRMVYLEVKKQMESDFLYLDKIKQQYIIETVGEYTEALSKLFFTRGQFPWVRSARALFSDDAKMIGISAPTIAKFFKKNGGKIDKRTVNTYANNFN